MKLRHWNVKRTSRNYQAWLGCEKLGTSHEVKGFAIGSFLERIVVERANDNLCQKNVKKALVWSVQNRSISSEIWLENNHKIGRFLPIAFWRSLPWNFPRNSGEIGRFFREFDPKNLAKFDFFPRDLSEALNLRMTGRGSRLSSGRLKDGGQSTAGTTNQAWWKQIVYQYHYFGLSRLRPQKICIYMRWGTRQVHVIVLSFGDCV